MSGYFEGLIGTRLGGFVVRRMIARGGMGVVYEGYQESLDRPVAIKILYPHLSDDPGFTERFQREARALAQLSHPNIVRIIDFGTSDKYVYMIMELVEGHSLRDELVELRGSGRALGMARAVEIVEAVGSALTYAHGRGLVHRDIKPGNVLINEAGHVFLTDFGLVKLAESTGATATGAIMGTPEYMAPEQFVSTADAGPAADQYSLAVVAYEMLAGRAPFQAPTPVGLMHKHLQEAPPPIVEFDASLPESVEAVIRRALSKDPAARYPSVSAFARDLIGSSTGAVTIHAASATPTVASPPAPATLTPVPEPTTPLPPAQSSQPELAVATSAPVAATATPSWPATSARIEPPPAPASVAAPAPAVERGRPNWIRLALLTLVPLLIIGGLAAVLLGGGGDDDSDPTATTSAGVEGTSALGSSDPLEETATAEATVTTTMSADPTATAAVEPTAPPTATATTASSTPTPTRPPVVVTRQIVNVPTPTVPLINVPTPADEGEFTNVVEADFVEGEDFSGWAILDTGSEFTATISDGHYVIDILVNDFSVFSYPAAAENIADGAMAVSVRVEGDGLAGIMVRRSETADGLSSMYECRFSNAQEFTCRKQVNGEWTDLVPLQYSAAIIPNDYNVIAIGATGSNFVLNINDTQAATWTDEALTSGSWGMFASRNVEGSSLRAFYDAVVIATD